MRTAPTVELQRTGRALCLSGAALGALGLAGWYFEVETATTFIAGRPAKVVIVGPAGDVLSTYRKTILVPGIEALLSVAGDDDATVVATPYGRLSSLICYDNDFPSFVRAQVGRAGVDILIDPSGDWEDIDPYHTNMMAFRAIENGFSAVRITMSGLSAAYDYQGRTLATMDYFKTDDKVFTAYVPLRGVTTLYSRVGDLFAWMTIAGLIYLVGRAVLRGRRPAAVEEGAQ